MHLDTGACTGKADLCRKSFTALPEAGKATGGGRAEKRAVAGSPLWRGLLIQRRRLAWGPASSSVDVPTRRFFFGSFGLKTCSGFLGRSSQVPSRGSSTGQEGDWALGEAGVCRFLLCAAGGLGTPGVTSLKEHPLALATFRSHMVRRLRRSGGLLPGSFSCIRHFHLPALHGLGVIHEAELPVQGLRV